MNDLMKHDHSFGPYAPPPFDSVVLPWRLLYAVATDGDTQRVCDDNDCVECWRICATALAGMVIGDNQCPSHRADTVATIEKMLAHYMTLGEKLS